MQCCVDYCSNTSDNVSAPAEKGQGEHKWVSFYRFPGKASLRAAWLKALGKQNCYVPDAAVVCSQHFLHDDICETESGARQLRTGAVPSTVLVCMICLNTDSKMFRISRYNLREAYEKLTGHTLCDGGNLKQTVCVQCAQRLRNFSRFREQSLRAHSVMMELLKKHELITIQHIKMINRVQYQLNSDLVSTTLGPDHWDLYIEENYDENTQTDLEETVQKVEVKSECGDVSKDVDGMFDVYLKLESKQEDIIQDLLKRESSVEHAEIDYSTELRHNSSHSQKTCFTCNVCQKGFKRKNLLVNHMKSHIKAELLFCKLCKFKSKYRSVLITHHMQTHTTKPFACELCEYKTKLRANLVRHMNIHTGQKRFACEFCEFKCAAKYNLDSHMSIHTGEKPLACEFCEYKCKRKSHLIRHMISHASERPFACEFCDYKFKQKSHLVRHTRCHTGEKPFACELCNYKCAAKFSLVNHMSIHTGEKPFACEVCDYRSERKALLLRHLSIHTGEKPFACELCDYKSNQKTHLERHMNIHTSEKPFACELCEYKTKYKANLIVHRRTHTGVEQFACVLCEYKSKRKADLVRHIKSHSSD